jgi:ribonuclease HII
VANRIIIGVDEVGFGAIAGPLVVAAVAFESGVRQPVLKREKFERGKDVPIRDSKTIKHALLPRMRALVEENCIDFMVMQKSPREIDRVGVQEARREAMCATVQRLLERVAFAYPGVYENYRVIVDGDLDLGMCHFKYTSKPKADETVWQVSAASILAKHTQVHAMLALHDKRKQYGWDKNKGYPTKDHLAALKMHGISTYHRRSYKPVQEFRHAR